MTEQQPATDVDQVPPGPDEGTEGLPAEQQGRERDGRHSRKNAGSDPQD